jgi:hypothetical protein
MLDAAGHSRSLKPIVRKECPWILDQLRQTAKYPEYLDLWGKSLNFDEHALAVIVEPPILAVIGELAGVPMRGRMQHAGLMHTFGYLFSLIETPYGKKRDRWVRPDLDRGLGFDSPTLRDQPKAGSLLLNLTYFLGNIAFRDDVVILERLQVQPNAASPAVRDYPYDELSIRRIVEETTIEEGRRKGTRIVIHTDFVTLPNPPDPTGEPNTLLVYSVVNGPRGNPQLMTAFTVTTDFVKQATAKSNQGENVEIRTRYNAFVEGLTGRPTDGRRSVND